MRLPSLSHWLDEVLQPTHPYFQPIQMGLLIGISYLSTAYLTSIPPHRATAFILSTSLISQQITPLFVKFFERYKESTLMPMMGQFMQLSTSIILAKTLCHLFKQSLSFSEIKKVSLLFIMSHYIAQWALLK